MTTDHFDVIVVGAGSGGGILAPRLTDDPSRRVLLLEAGPDFPDELALLPGFYSGGHQLPNMFVADHDWGYASEPLPDNNGGRVIRLPRGKLVGGSSMVNAQMLIRPAPFDIARWNALGATRWTWDDVRPHLDAVEREIPHRTYPRSGWQQVQLAYEQAMLGLGYRPVDDLNAPDAWHGVIGATPMNRVNEIRQGTLVTTLRAARGRANLDLRAGCLVDRLLFEGTRAVGVRYIGPDGQLHEARAAEIVLCGGAYGTPAILLRSGIGPEAQLREHGIPLVADLPVGERLLDHAALTWLVENRELADMRGPSCAVLARHPDNDWMGVAMTLDEPKGVFGIAFVSTSDNASGSLRLRSTDPTAAPLIRHVYDVDGHRSAELLVHELLATPQFKGSTFLDAGRAYEEIVRERIGTAYHPAGTAPLGSVVGDDLRVLGIDGLLVADASIFPAQISNNTNDLCYAFGELAARNLGAAARG